MRFVQYLAKPWETILDGASNLAVDFVSRLVQYESSWRMTASQVYDPFHLQPPPYTNVLINSTGGRSQLP
jgi:hypothetical protein